MSETLVLFIYRAFLPILFVFAFPGWVFKMLHRNGFGTGLHERFGIYTFPKDFEPCHAVHLHAISVGETALALKLIQAWNKTQPSQCFVLATGTATGHHLATQVENPMLRVTYSPLDFAWMVRGYLKRFEPSQIVLLEAEVWPILLRQARRQGIRVDLANARTSPRSARRLARFAHLLKPTYSLLSKVCIQEEEHRALWLKLGIPTENIHLTGSLKFDPGASPLPSLREDFEGMIEIFGKNRPLILAASTFSGEEAMIAQAIREANPDALPVIVPRHAERRAEVIHELNQIGFGVVLRSSMQSFLQKHQASAFDSPTAFVIDSTGELATWICHADCVIMGKSFLHVGGQNPAEAILAHKPLIIGPNMDNFQPLCHTLIEQKGALLASDQAEIVKAIGIALDPRTSQKLVSNARQVLNLHNGATIRHLSVLQDPCTLP